MPIETPTPANETVLSRITVVELMQAHQGSILERTVAAIELIAALSERLAFHIEDVKGIKGQLSDSKKEIEDIKVRSAEVYAFYRDIKLGIISILGVILTGLGGLIWHVYGRL